LVERWFAELTSRKLRRSAHRSVTELELDSAAVHGPPALDAIRDALGKPLVIATARVG